MTITAECKELRKECKKLQDERAEKQAGINDDLYQKHDTLQTAVTSIVEQLAGIRGGLTLLNTLIGIIIAALAIYFAAPNVIHKVTPQQQENVISPKSAR